MRTFTIAAAQMSPRQSIRETGSAIATLLQRAAARGATHLITPEIILTGYHDRFDQAERDRVIAEVLQPTCKKFNIALNVGAGNRRNSAGRMMRKPAIQVTVINAHGRIIGTHDKTIPVHSELRWCRRGLPRNLRVFRTNDLTFGVTICNDFWATPI